MNEWWRSAVFYQVYPRSFADSDGDGIGDLRGLIERLDYLAELGIDVVWLSPVYPSPQADNGYDISDYQAIDPTFGTLEDFDELVAGLHRRGMKLVIDIVANHTSDQHPWFLESRSGKDSPKRDWYWWRPARDGWVAGTPGAEPNNWEGFFGGSTWTYDPSSGEYYLHLFAEQQPDLNWENPEVRQALHAMLRWWLARGVDGFRLDVINLVSKVPELPDGEGGDGFPYYCCGPRLHEFMAELRREVFDGHHRPYVLIGETPGISTAEARLLTDPARGELDMVFTFEHVSLDHGVGKFDVQPLAPGALAACLERLQNELGDAGWMGLYLANHDQPRSVTRFGDDSPEFRDASAKTLALLAHGHRGSPFVYQGEEIGMSNFPFDDIDAFRDVESLNHYQAAVASGAPASSVLAGLRAMSRDNARTPMQWDGSPHAGFTTGTPWLPAHPDFVSVNADEARRSPDSVWHFYRRLIALRHAEPVLAHGSFRRLDTHDDAVYALERVLDDRELVVVCNLSGAQRRVDLPWLADFRVLLATGPIPEPDSSGVVLPAWSGFVALRCGGSQRRGRHRRPLSDRERAAGEWIALPGSTSHVRSWT
ncbi:MAG TPA: alpha-glucosidase [Propionibacteriaceae bacterium]|nr:alpha-glucosidase [Propionibacteriaceae bacterium]